MAKIWYSVAMIKVTHIRESSYCEKRHYFNHSLVYYVYYWSQDKKYNFGPENFSVIYDASGPIYPYYILSGGQHD
jgi:hypothetical protein